MFNRRFADLVRLQLINAMTGRRAGAPPSPSGRDREVPDRYSPTDAAAFVDLQNMHYFLKENCRIASTQVHLPNLLREFADSNGLKLVDIFVFTGIHDPERDRQKHQAMAKRLQWMHKNGVQVTALPLSYFPIRDAAGRETGEFKTQEKGVDVRLGSEIIRAVNNGLRQALVFSQDKDISQAVHVAAEIAADRGRSFTAFSPVLAGAEWEHSGKCGMHGIRGTTRLPFHVDLARRHVREQIQRD